MIFIKKMTQNSEIHTFLHTKNTILQRKNVIFIKENSEFDNQVNEKHQKTRKNKNSSYFITYFLYQ